MSVQELLISDKDEVAPAAFITSQELALLLSPTLLAWFDARDWYKEIVGLTIPAWWSRKQIGVLNPGVITPSIGQGYYGGIVPGGTSRYEIRVGIDQNNVPVPGANNKLASGNAVFTIPAGSFTMLIYCRMFTPASSTILIGNNNTANPFSWEPLSNFAIRIYATRTTGLIATNPGAIPDQNYHMLCFKYDAVNKLGQIEVDSVVQRSYIAMDLSSQVGSIFQFGQIIDNGTQVLAGSGYAAQGVLLSSGLSYADQTLYQTILNSRAS